MGLYVVGMHRSGTSAVTEALASLPFDLPDAGEMLGGNESNPRGHWEISALTEFNQELLERAGASWLAPSTLAIEEMERLSNPELGLDAQAGELVSELFSGSNWLFKDPRLAITMPFWRKVLPPHPSVLVLRHPIEIARSLRVRNHMALPYGLALWERYLRSAISALEGTSVHVTSFSDILAGGSAVTDLIEFAASAIGADVNPDIDSTIGEIIDPTLRNQDIGTDAERELLSTSQSQLLEVLQKARGTHAELSLNIDKIPETPGLELAFASGAAFERGTQRAVRERADLVASNLRRTFGETQTAWAEKESAWAARDSERDIEEAAWHSRESEWSKNFDELHRQGAEAAIASEERESLLVSELDRLRDQLAIAEMASSDTQRSATDAQQHVDHLQSELDTAVHHRNLAAGELGRLTSSKSVKYPRRVANGLRKIAALDRAQSDRAQSNKAQSDTAQSDGDEGSPNGPQTAVEASNPAFDSLVEAFEAGLFDRRLTVIIPVYNAFEALQRCFEAFRRFTPESVELIVINDASPDERIASVMEQIAERTNTTVLTNEINQGFTKTVNRGLAERERSDEPGDVIILNSDTLVTPRWTERLRAVGHENAEYATVTPLSNAAGVFSFTSPLPTSPDGAAALSTAMVRGSKFLRPTGPTGNGFCLYVKAEALDVISRLDGEAFPRGYGEENDFCMKLGVAGFTHVIADDVAVFHEESASFGDEAKATLIEAGLAVLDERYPHYRQDAQNFVASPDFVAARANASAGIEAGGDHLRRRVLTVLHDGGGGTDYHVQDLVRSLSDTYEPLLLIPQGNDLVLWSADDPNQRIELARWTLSRPWDVRRMNDPEHCRVALELLTRFGIELVHIHHLIGHSFDLPAVAKSLGIPVVLTLHDFYMACPSVNLLDNNNQFCGGTCTAGEGSCATPVWIDDDIDLKHRFVNLWRDDARRIVESVDAIITPSADTKKHFTTIFGTELGNKIQAIEHGREFDRARTLNKSPKSNEPIKILMVGAINESKGVRLASELGRIGRDRNVEVELLGEIQPGFGDTIRSYGKYERDELSTHLAQRRPTFIGVFSIWAETHCYVISEAWANGVPVLVGPLGAPAERVKLHGGGIIADSFDPRVIIDLAVRTARDRVGYAELASAATLANVRSVDAMANDYRELYAGLFRSTGA